MIGTSDAVVVGLMIEIGVEEEDMGLRSVRTYIILVVFCLMSLRAGVVLCVFFICSCVTQMEICVNFCI